MAFSHKIKQEWAGNGVAISSENTYSGGAQKSIDDTFADATTDALVNLAIDVSQLKSMYMVSDQDITVETNSPSAPTDTINLLAGVPLIWHTNYPYTNKITADVTAMYVTNSSGATARLQIEVIEDPTP